MALRDIEAAPQQFGPAPGEVLGDAMWLVNDTELATEVKALRERVAALELEVQAVAQLSQRVTDLDTLVESIGDAQRLQQEQYARWKEGAAALEPVITAMCTQLDCLDQQGMVVLHQPVYLRRRSEEALETIRRLSRYKGEEAEQNEFVVASLMKEIGNNMHLPKHR